MDWPVFEPLIPSSLWLALAAVAGALLVVYAVRRPAVMSRARWAWTVGGMALAVVLVLAILLNPTWVERVAPPGGKPVLTVLVDSTASMGTPDAPGGRVALPGGVRGGGAGGGGAGEEVRRAGEDVR